MDVGSPRPGGGRALSRGAVVALVVAAGALLAATASASETKLRGTVGPGFTITLTDEAGNPVRTLAPGAYEIELEDRSDEHNFHLTGPGVDIATGVDEIGSRTFKVTLQEGTYTFICDPHPTRMRGSFTVGSGSGSGGGSTSPGGGTTPATPSAPVGARLVLTSGPGFTITLRTAAGKKVTRLRPGAYTVVVRDRSTSHNARLRGPGVNRATTVPFVGTQTWRVSLRRGTLTFVCDPHASTMRGTVLVAPSS